MARRNLKTQSPRMGFCGEVHAQTMEVSSKMVRTPKTYLDENYQHSPQIRALSPEAAIDIARREAIDLEDEVNPTIPQSTSSDPIYYPVAAAVGPRRWLMDTGTPFDIVSVNDVNAEAESHKVRSDHNVT